MTINNSKNKIDFQSFLAIAMVMIFLIAKLYRNSIDFSSGKQGGIWNYALVILVVFAIFALVFYWKKISNSKIIKLLIVYSIIVWINSLVRLNDFSISYIYTFIVSSIFVPVLIVSYHINSNKNERIFNCIWYLGWGLILALLLVSYIIFLRQYQYYQSSDIISLNNSYYVACAIPFFLMKKDKKNVLDYFYIVLSLIVVFISNKRAGFIATVIGLILYFVVNAKISKTTNKSSKIIITGLFLLAVSLLTFYIIDTKYDLNIFYRLSMVFDDKGSGRVEIYNYVWNEIKTSNVLDIVFGHGLNSIAHLEMPLSSAHNDFLNILYENGIIPMLILIAFYLSMIAIAFKMIKQKYDNSGAFVFSLVLSFSLSLVSANLDSQSFSIVLAFYWGAELSRWDRIKNNG